MLLSETERNAFLVRAARGERINAELLRRLRAVGGKPQASSSSAKASQRTFAAIVADVEKVRRERKEREQREAERLHAARMEELATRDGQVWARIPELLGQRNASGYDQAVALMIELRDLAIYLKQREAFNAQLKALLMPYTSAALQRRLQEKKLV